jgi:hypothetical protein
MSLAISLFHSVSTHIMIHHNGVIHYDDVSQCVCVPAN